MRPCKIRVVGQFELDCNSQAFGILKGFNLVAVGELRDAHGWRINILLDPERVKPSGKCEPYRVRIRSERSVGVAALTHGY